LTGTVGTSASAKEVKPNNATPSVAARIFFMRMVVWFFLL
jgi:hypothetical protein